MLEHFHHVREFVDAIVIISQKNVHVKKYLTFTSVHINI